MPSGWDGIRIFPCYQNELGSSNRRATLRQVVRDVNYTGSLFELPGYLKTRGIPVEPNRVFSITDYMGLDLQTEVTAVAKSMIVREVLTGFVSLKGRSGRVIWESATPLGNNAITTVDFHL